MNKLDSNHLNVSYLEMRPKSDPEHDKVQAVRITLDQKCQASSAGDLSSQKERLKILRKKKKAYHELGDGQSSNKKRLNGNSTGSTKKIYENIPIDTCSLKLVHSSFNSVTKNRAFLEAYHSRCLDCLKKRFIDAELSEERFKSFVKIAQHRLKAAGKKTTNLNRLRELIEFQKERLPSQLFTEGSTPVTLEEFVEREWVIKQHNTFLIAKTLFGHRPIPFDKPTHKSQLKTNYGYILNHLEGLRSMVDVNLENLGITEFPVEIASHLTNARALKISKNRLSFLSKKCFDELPNLQKLGLDSNHLTTLGRGTFSGLTNLHKLWLFGNQLTLSEKDMFLGLTGLQTLRLDGNRLTKLENGTLSGLVNLRFLRLDGNQLTVSNEDMFSGLTGLQTLGIDVAQLTASDQGILSKLTGLQTLTLFCKQLTERDRGTILGLTGVPKIWLHCDHLASRDRNAFSRAAGLKVLTLY